MSLDQLLSNPYMKDSLLELLQRDAVLNVTITCKTIFGILSPLVSLIMRGKDAK